MNSAEAREKIIYFVAGHQGCIAQDVVDGVADVMSRTLVFRYLPQLIKERIIEDKKQNRRDHRFFVNSVNPLLLLTQELDEFENSVVAFVENAKANYEERFQLSMKNTAPSVVAAPTIQFFSHVVETYLTYAFFKWPSEIKDKELLEEMYTTLFAKLTRLASRLSGLIEWAMSGNWKGCKPFKHNFDFSYMLIINDTFADVGLATKEYGALMDIIWKISSNILPEDVRKMGWNEALESYRDECERHTRKLKSVPG